MNSINLFFLTRYSGEKRSLYEKNLSNRDVEIKFREEEFLAINALINNLKFYKASSSCLEDWYYSFSLPQIGKEFDLLKIEENGIIVNIEFKSQMVDEEKIVNQLRKNYYYLSILSSEIHCFSFVLQSKTHKIYYYDNGNLKIVNIDCLIKVLEKINAPIKSNIEEYFSPKKYLVSPINNPTRFIRDEYYLTNQQEQIKKDISTRLNQKNTIYGITGSAGTGKTLLLYDLAKYIAEIERKRVLLVHAGTISDGQKIVNDAIANLRIIDAKNLNRTTVRNAEVVLVDESHRLYEDKLYDIFDWLNEGIINNCIFSYDYCQCLSVKEQERNIPVQISEYDSFIEYSLSDRIRSNKEITSFLRIMFNLNDIPKMYIEYKNIDILYVEQVKDLDTIIETYETKGYKFIISTPSLYKYSFMNRYSEKDNSHKVIGKEYDKVLTFIGSEFYYGEDGILNGSEHPNPDYIYKQLLFQNITRAREKLCIVVFDNIPLFEKLISIKGGLYYK